MLWFPLIFLSLNCAGNAAMAIREEKRVYMTRMVLNGVAAILVGLVMWG